MEVALGEESVVKLAPVAPLVVGAKAVGLGGQLAMVDSVD